MSDISISTGHPDAGRVYAEALDRVTAERDALQERLNAADQSEDDLQFQLHDREGSRRDWFEAAQAAEKRVEELSKDLCKCIARSNDFESKMQGAKSEAEILRAQLAERDALLRECASEFSTAEASAFEVEMRRKIEAALSASAEPSAPVERDLDDDPFFVQQAEPNSAAPKVERDERADDFTEKAEFKKWYLSAQIDERGAWSAWQARAALDKRTGCAPVGDGLHDDTEAVRAAMKRKP